MIPCRKCSIHVTNPHRPTHAGRDARGPQNGAGPPNSGLTGRGGASSWESRRPRWPSISAWNGEVRVGTESLPSPVAMGGTRRGWGPREWKPHPCHNTPLPHPCGQGCPRTTNRHLPQPQHCPMPARAPALPGTHINACWLGCPRSINRHLPPPHHCPMPARAPALPGTHIHACRRGRSHGPTSAHSHRPQISADQETVASRRNHPLPDKTR